MAKTTKPERKTNKSKKLPPEVFSAQEIRGLITACGRTVTGLRNAGLIATLYGAGLRISEALELKPADVDLVAGSVRIRHGKGDKFRVVGLDPSCQAVLEIWMQRRTSMGINGREPIFCAISKHVKGNRLETAYIRAMLPRMGKRAGIEKRIHAHGLRHSLAARMVDENQPITVISGQLGHSSVSVTDKYLQRVAPGRLVEVMRSANRLPD